MKNRIKNIFLKTEKKLVTFVTGGDPDLETSLNIIKKLSDSGADMIEIGMPFSDPMADGPTIQLSSNRSIKNGINLDDIFKISAEFRKYNDSVPLILMGYYNVIFNYGIQNFVNSCNKVGIDGLIIVDLQPEEDPELSKALESTSINLIRLITPTTNENRLKTILQNASGFLYFVTITGITGQNSANINELKNMLAEVKKHTKLPIVSGFGIKNVDQIKQICKFSDGVVVGSSIVKIIEENYITNKNKLALLISNYIKNLKQGTH